MVKDVIVIYSILETLLILTSLKRNFSYPRIRSSLTLRKHCNFGPCKRCVISLSSLEKKVTTSNSLLCMSMQ